VDNLDDHGEDAKDLAPTRPTTTMTSPGADEGGVHSPLYSVDVGSRSGFGILVQRVPGTADNHHHYDMAIGQIRTPLTTPRR
jgi:hypothetical protein